MDHPQQEGFTKAYAQLGWRYCICDLLKCLGNIKELIIKCDLLPSFRLYLKWIIALCMKGSTCNIWACCQAGGAVNMLLLEDFCQFFHQLDTTGWWMRTICLPFQPAVFYHVLELPWSVGQHHGWLHLINSSTYVEDVKHLLLCTITLPGGSNINRFWK